MQSETKISEKEKLASVMGRFKDFHWQQSSYWKINRTTVADLHSKTWTRAPLPPFSVQMSSFLYSFWEIFDQIIGGRPPPPNLELAPAPWKILDPPRGQKYFIVDN